MKMASVTCLLLLGACSTTTEVNTTGALLEQAVVPEASDTGRVLFARLHKQNEQWQIVSIGSRRMPVDLLKGDERVFIQTDTGLVLPDYEHHQYRDVEKKLFDCGQTVSYNKHTTYNPCISQFSSNTRFGEGWFGWTRRLDMTEIDTAIQQTGLLERARQEMILVNQERQRCLVLRQQAEQLIAKQKVALRVIDETRMYKQGHELVSYDLNIRPEIPTEGCEQELARVKLSYELGVVQDIGLVLEFRGKTDWRKLDGDKLSLQRSIAEADKALQPTLYITGKKVKHYNLYKTFANQDVALTWRTIDISDTDLRQLFDVSNLGNVTIEIKQVSFYINKHVITQRSQHRLPPLARETGLEHASRYFLLEKTIRENVDAIKTIDNITEQAEFSIKLTYMLNGEEKSLFKTETVQLSSVL